MNLLHAQLETAGDKIRQNEGNKDKETIRNCLKILKVPLL